MAGTHLAAKPANLINGNVLCSKKRQAISFYIRLRGIFKMLKSGLIVGVPLKSLSKADFEKVRMFDTRYDTIIKKSAADSGDESFIEIRRKMEPYTFSFLGETYTIITCTRKEAVKSFENAGHHMKDVEMFSVEKIIPGTMGSTRIIKLALRAHVKR